MRHTHLPLTDENSQEFCTRQLSHSTNITLLPPVTEFESEALTESYTQNHALQVFLVQ